MQQFSSLVDLPPQATWLTIGSFDGVHRGHQEILHNLVTSAHLAHARAAVLTFFPHPSVVLRGQSGPFYLTTPEERAQLISRHAVDMLITLPFTRELANITAQDFMTELKQKLQLARLWVGYNFTLGRNREGDVPTLQRLGDLLDYQLEVVPPIMIEGEIVSSSQIRGLISKGIVDRAEVMLGRPYQVDGRVVPGDARGRLLGIPTANLSIWPDWLLPANGVYAGKAWVNGKDYQAVINIGSRPTFEAADVPIRMEAHLLNFNHDLYGKTLKVDFIQRLRDEKRFPSVDALLDQIHQDIQTAREILTP